MTDKTKHKREDIDNDQNSLQHLEDKKCKWEYRHSYMKKIEGRVRCKLCGKSLYD